MKRLDKKVAIIYRNYSIVTARISLDQLYEDHEREVDQVIDFLGNVGGIYEIT